MNLLTTYCLVISPSNDVFICCLSIVIGISNNTINKDISCKNKTAIAIMGNHAITALRTWFYSIDFIEIGLFYLQAIHLFIHKFILNFVHNFFISIYGPIQQMCICTSCKCNFLLLKTKRNRFVESVSTRNKLLY